MIKSEDDAYELLISLGANDRLIEHLQLVGAAAKDICLLMQKLNISFDSALVMIGAACHDAGKVLFPNELNEAGSLHEIAGEKLLLQKGVSAEIARFCVSHACYDKMYTSFEELLVALADKLWKGKRVPDLELLVIDASAELLKADRWSVFEELDNGFEDIARNGHHRLQSTIR